MTKKIKNLVIFICLVAAMLALANFALAAELDVGLDKAAGTGLSAAQDPRVIAANIIRIALGFLGIIATGLIIYAGWLWMSAAGEAEKIEKAKKILIGAVIGLVIALSAFAIASFILSRLVAATGGQPGGPGDGGGIIPDDGGVGAACDANTLEAGCQVNSTSCRAGLYCDTVSCTCQVSTLPGDGQPCLTDSLDGQCAAGQCAAGLSCQQSTCTCQADARPVEGQSCDGDTNLAGCQVTDCADNLVCSSNDNCTCVRTPLIAWISPLDAADTANGAAGNFITIGGRYFGTTPGQVIFMGDPNNSGDDKTAVFPNQANPLCVNFWQDNQIVAVVPEGAVSGPVKVADSRNYYDTTDNNRGARLKDFLINDIKRPGLCQVDPTSGGLADEFTLQGSAFNVAARAVLFGSGVDTVLANDISGWTDTSVKATVPNIRDGRNSVFVQADNINSNSLTFTVSNRADANPVIEYIEPDRGPVGQYITIYGRNFKIYDAQKSWVKFYWPADPVNLILANTDFPEQCRLNWWHDKYIIVKVPPVARDKLGIYKVVVNNSAGKTSLPADFTINNEAAGPGMCLLEPNNGPVAWPVSAYGERFGSSQANRNVQFFNNKDGAARDWSQQKIETNVPNGAVSGPVKIVKKIDGANVSDSNSLPFRVGKCSLNSDCESGEECCGGGTYWSGICRAAGSCAQGSPLACEFGWTFKTSKKQVGDPCYDGGQAGACDITQQNCGSDLVCDPTGCICKQACNSDLNNDQNKCVPDNNKCANTNTPVCNSTNCLCECTTDKDCLNGQTCNPATNICDDGPPLESCAGYGPGQCLVESFLCPNSPGKCSSNAGGPVDTGVKCGDEACGQLGRCQDADGNNLCSYIKNDANKNIDNKCKKNSSFCLKPQTLKDPDGNDVTAECSLLSGYGNPVWNYNSSGDCLTDWVKDEARNKCVTPAYNNVECKPCTAGAACGLPQTFADAAVKEIEGNAVMVQCSKVDNKAVWYYASSKTCVTGWVKNINRDKCVKQNYDGKSCELCDAGFSCQQDGANEINNGICATDINICPADSSCASAKNECVKTKPASCECCCNKTENTASGSNPACCTGLSCQDSCGAGGDFGLCTGCTVKNAAGAVDQAASNAKCNCDGTSGRFCSTNEANGLGTCLDCAALTKGDECSSKGAGSCCVDAKNKNACIGGADTVKSSNTSDQNNYCAYYQCQTTSVSAVCSGPVASSTLPTYKTADCDAKCTVSPDFGQPCSKKVAQIDQCAADVCPNFSCLDEHGYGVGNPSPTYAPNPKDYTCGTCCCDPKKTGENDQCQRFINPKLSCLANKGSCSGGSRGLCCGCSKDNECGNDNTGCGSGGDRCCQPRPSVTNVAPDDKATKVCRNSLIKATFDQAMNINIFKTNIIVVGDYKLELCPAGTQYLTAVYKPSIFVRLKFWLAKIPLVNKLFASPARALTGNFCSVAGQVSGLVKIDAGGKQTTELEFRPKKALGADRKYYVIIKGDSDVNDAVSNGVLSQDGIGMKGEGYDSENPVMFNGLAFANAKVWSFTTKEDTAADNGLCLVDYVAIEPSSYLFNTAVNDSSDDDPAGSNYDTIKDSDKVFRATAYSLEKQAIAPLEDDYNWRWDWAIDDKSVVKFKTGEEALLDRPEQTIAAQNVKDANTLVRAKAVITQDQVNQSPTVGQSKEGAAPVYVFLCSNPWPPFRDDGGWSPWQDTWQDNNSNCTVAANDCKQTNFALYYCRDAGAAGTVDDLPAIMSDSTVIRGQENDDILKEFYFFREDLPKATGISLATTTNDEIKRGGRAGLVWQAVAEAQKYTIYYGTVATNLTQSIIVTTNGIAAEPAIISNLTNGVKYYFAVTATYDTGAESAYSNKTTAIPADVAPPETPTELAGAVETAGATVSWTANQDDTAFYKIYYGATSGALGASVSLDKNKCANGQCKLKINNLNSGTIYYFAISAIDGYKNESNKSEEINLIIK